MPAADRDTIWRIADSVHLLDADGQEEALSVLQDHLMELRMRPPDPSVGRVKGATKPQLALFDAFFRSPKDWMIYACAGANQSGKTDGVGVCFCKHIRDEARDGDVYWVLAQSYNTLKDIPLKVIYQFLPKSMFPPERREYDPTIHEIPVLKLKLPDGRGYCEVWWRSEDQGLMKLESARLNGIWWTECADQNIFDALLPRLVARNGWMLMDYVPFQGWHRTVLREKSAKPNSPIWYHKFVIADNAHNIGEKTIERMKASMSEKMWQIRGLGKEAAAQGAVYQNFDPDLHVIEPFKVPEYWPLYMAADWGFNAPHAFGLFAVSPNDTVYLVAEDYRAQMSVPDTVMALWEMVSSVRRLRLYPGCRDSGEMFEQLRAIDFRRRRHEMNDDFLVREIEMEGNAVREHVASEFSRVLTGPCAIDNQVFQDHGGQQTLAQEFFTAGLPVQPAVKRSIDATVEIVRRMFDTRKLLFFSTCPHVREDHVAWMYKEGKDHTVLPTDRYGDEYSHGCDMVRYAMQINMKFEEVAA